MIKIWSDLTDQWKKILRPIRKNICRFCQFPIIYENINFVVETSSRAHFKDNLMLINPATPIMSFSAVEPQNGYAVPASLYEPLRLIHEEEIG